MIEVTGDRNLGPGELERKPWLKSYPPDVPFHLHYPEIPLYAFLDEVAKDWPDKIALVFAPTGTEMTYAELLEKTNRFAHALQNLGVKKGDRVTIMLPNCFQFVIAFYGILKAGAVVTPLNPRYTPRELQELLSDSGAEIMICLDQMYPLIKSIQPATSIQRIITVQLSPEPIKTGKDALHFSVLISQNAPNFRPVEIDPKEDLAALQYTAGTTGRSKGVMLTHRSITCVVVGIRICSGELGKANGRQETFLGVVPPFHIAGILANLLLPTYIGAKTILLPRFNPRETLAAISQYRITYFMAVPAIYNALLSAQNRESDRYSLLSVKFAHTGTSPCPIYLLQEFDKRFKYGLLNAYGLTETAGVCITNLTKFNKFGSVGFPLPDLEIKIIDQRTGKISQSREVGEILLRGPHITKGYWHSPKETKETFTEDGWLHTGDLGRLDPDGYLFIVDRVKDIINVRGEKVSSLEIEMVLEEHPAVTKAAVIGVPDTYWGERVIAFLTVSEEVTEEELIAFCKKRLTDYKIPREIRILDHLPLSSVGKILKKELRKEAIKGGR